MVAQVLCQKETLVEQEEKVECRENPLRRSRRDIDVDRSLDNASTHRSLD